MLGNDERPFKITQTDNNYENWRLSAGLDLYLTLGHKVNDYSSIILNCCVLFY